MKQFIVLFSTIMLGVFIFNLIMGDSDDTILSTVQNLWEGELAMRAQNP